MTELVPRRALVRRRERGDLVRLVGEIDLVAGQRLEVLDQGIEERAQRLEVVARVHRVRPGRGPVEDVRLESEPRDLHLSGCGREERVGSIEALLLELGGGGCPVLGRRGSLGRGLLGRRERLRAFPREQVFETPRPSEVLRLELRRERRVLVPHRRDRRLVGRRDVHDLRLVLVSHREETREIEEVLLRVREDATGARLAGQCVAQRFGDDRRRRVLERARGLCHERRGGGEGLTEDLGVRCTRLRQRSRSGIRVRGICGRSREPARELTHAVGEAARVLS